MQNLGSKVLKTERLTLRPFRESDARAMFENWAGDPEVTKYLTWTPHKNVEETRKRCSVVESMSAQGNYYHWAIEFEGELIGDIELGEIDWTETGNVGYCMAKKYWGKGLMTEAFREAIRFAFEEVGLHRIEGMHAAFNIGSSRVMEKCGLKYEGLKRGGYRLPSSGEWVDIVVRGILKEDYFAKK